jgi:predicted transcriptional regulator
VDLRHAQLNISSPQDVAHPAGWWWSQDATGIFTQIAGFNGWTRRAAFDGDATARGDLGLYLRGAQIEAMGLSVGLGPWTTTEFSMKTAALERRQVLFEDAFLDLHEVTWHLPRHVELVCGRIEGDVQGAYVADQASGNATGASKRVEFDNRVVSLEGTFHVDDAPSVYEPGQPPMAHAAAEGDIRVIGIDFDEATRAAPSWATPQALGLWAIFVAIVVIGVKSAGSVVGAFYSRFGRDRALENPNRDTVYQAILQNPGVDLSGLRGLTPFHLTTVAYHVQVLRRVGLVSTLKHGHSVRVVPRERMNARDLPSILASHDARLAFVRAQTQEGPLPLRDLAARLMKEFSLARRAAYELVDRAAATQLVKKTCHGREVSVECVSS